VLAARRRTRPEITSLPVAESGGDRAALCRFRPTRNDHWTAHPTGVSGPLQNEAPAAAEGQPLRAETDRNVRGCRSPPRPGGMKRQRAHGSTAESRAGGPTSCAHAGVSSARTRTSGSRPLDADGGRPGYDVSGWCRKPGRASPPPPPVPFRFQPPPAPLPAVGRRPAPLPKVSYPGRPGDDRGGRRWQAGAPGQARRWAEAADRSAGCRGPFGVATVRASRRRRGRRRRAGWGGHGHRGRSGSPGEGSREGPAAPAPRPETSGGA
jgi:hypothetical protein